VSEDLDTCRNPCRSPRQSRQHGSAFNCRTCAVSVGCLWK